jgi:hypothetical protein
MIPRIAAAGTSFSPLPCQAWHGYGATRVHRVEVEVGADGPASAPPSWAAAAAPPAGAAAVHLVYAYSPIGASPLFYSFDMCATCPHTTIASVWLAD